MRYLDWDVLLFPGAGEEASHIPLREFKTTAHAIRDRRLEHSEYTRATSISPLLHCFVPSLAHNAPFQISVHSWSTQRFHYKQNHSREGVTHVWQIRVLVDGVCVCVETFDEEETQWPKVIASENWSEARQVVTEPTPLRFPPFYQHVMQQRNWAAYEDEGRIKVIVSEGHVSVDPQRGDRMFHPLDNHAIFNFQPAPWTILQNAGIAWPNPYMLSKAAYPDQLPANVQNPGPAHSRNVSQSSFQSSPYVGRLPGPPPPTPNMDDGSRSTSAYSTILPNYLPLGVQPPPTYPGMAMSTNKAMEVRLPSDQFTRLLRAISPPDGSMPPPPIPAPALQQTPTKAQPDRRVANVSDISMHADYQSFPDCTSVDEHGHIVHVPAQAVRSRKEGSLDTNNRDFLSSILNPASSPAARATSQMDQDSKPARRDSVISSSPAGDNVRKRTRASLKALTVNDEGSPEKKSENNETEQDAKRPALKVSTPPMDQKENLQMGDAMVLDV